MKDSTSFAEPEETTKRAKAIVKAATHFYDHKVLLEVSEDLTGAMKGHPRILSRVPSVTWAGTAIV